MTLRVVIVDDEPLARRRLATLVERCAAARVVGHAGSADEALEVIARVDPDVALLDVRMPPGVSGVELAKRFGGRPIAIFTTAHAEHAVDAFDAAAADYLLKPVELAKLARALDRAAARLATVGVVHEPRIAARSGGVVHIFAARAIARFRAEDKYTVFVVDDVEYLIDESLAALAERLAPWGFLRVHRGELVQLAHVRALVGDDSELELASGERVAVSRRSLASVRKALTTVDSG